MCQPAGYPALVFFGFVSQGLHDRFRVFFLPGPFCGALSAPLMPLSLTRNIGRCSQSDCGSVPGFMLYCRPSTRGVHRTMKKSELKNRTYSQLMSLAAQAGIAGRSRMNKAQLAAVLSDRRVRSARRRSVAARHGTGRRSPEELPTRYGRTRLTLMEIDPYRLHAFWEVTPKDQKAVAKRLGRDSSQASWIIRFHNVPESEDDETSTHFDVPVDLAAGNWYLDLPANGRSYQAELRLCTARGRFEPVCTSNTVHVPPAQASPTYDPEWLQVEQEMGATWHVSAPEAESLPQPSTEMTIDVFASSVDPARSSPRFIASISPTGSQRPSSYSSEVEWPPQSESSEEWYDSFAVGSWSQGGTPAENARGGDPLFRAEVVVRGRTQRGQTLWVNGEPVELNPDGTFCLCWTLPARGD